MIQPGIAAARFLSACLLGGILGVGYEFLRPLRPKYTALADLLFLGLTVLIWLELSFGVCGGDLRIGYCAGLIAGGFGVDLVLGRWLRPVFRGFWGLWGRMLRIFCFPLKKISDFAKFMFASAKKWVTIKCNNRRRSRRVPGGPTHGKKQNSTAQYADHISAQQSPDQGGGDLRYRVVYGSNDRHAPEPEQH